MKKWKSIAISLSGLGLLALAGCAGAKVSPQLADARLTMERARASEARTRAPGELYEAEQILAKAERAEDGSRAERHYAYLADRQARIAMSDGRTVQLSQQAAAAQRAYVAELERAAAEGRVAISVEQRGRQSAEQGARAAEQSAQAAEQQAAEAAARVERERQLAEQRHQEMLDQLAEVGAQVRQEPDSTIITVPGEVLFETDKSELRPTARQRLDVVADALKSQPQAHAGKIVVEGHADAHGAASYNQQLSQERAMSVRDFLVQEGVAANDIEVVGRGESDPIADNASPEGRANNRRVEIILPREPATQGGVTAPQQQQQQRPAEPLQQPERGWQEQQQRPPSGTQPPPEPTE